MNIFVVHPILVQNFAGKLAHGTPNGAAIADADLNCENDADEHVPSRDLGSNNLKNKFLEAQLNIQTNEARKRAAERFTYSKQPKSANESDTMLKDVPSANAIESYSQLIGINKPHSDIEGISRRLLQCKGLPIPIKSDSKLAQDGSEHLRATGRHWRSRPWKF